jgi:hypothetical protein
MSNFNSLMTTFCNFFPPYLQRWIIHSEHIYLALNQEGRERTQRLRAIPCWDVQETVKYLMMLRSAWPCRGCDAAPKRARTERVRPRHGAAPESGRAGRMQSRLSRWWGATVTAGAKPQRSHTNGERGRPPWSGRAIAPVGGAASTRFWWLRENTATEKCLCVRGGNKIWRERGSERNRALQRGDKIQFEFWMAVGSHWTCAGGRRRIGGGSRRRPGRDRGRGSWLFFLLWGRDSGVLWISLLFPFATWRTATVFPLVHVFLGEKCL